MKEQFEKREIVKKTENFSKWYTDVILKSELADYSPVKGCQVIRPYGFAIWENIKKTIDDEIKKAGVKNAYFPLFIPEKFLKKEKEHVKGFSPELAIVTIGGGKKLTEKLIVRPTSETIMYDMYSKWIKSWRDLPVEINQWCNIVRWEKRTRLFLRTTEFLWQEGHTAHATHKEAQKEVQRALDMYAKIYRNLLAIDGIVGRKSEFDKFPGAEETYTYEMMMPDGKALQGCTSHDLGQNFAKVFDIKFRDKSGKEKMVWQTSWGFTTRAIGALIMAHGDDMGLVLPPKIAPVQVVIIPVLQGKKQQDEKVLRKAREMKEVLGNSDKETNIRVEMDDRKEYSMGWKFNEWELKGVPLRIAIGPQELKKNEAYLKSRVQGSQSVTMIPLDKSKKNEIIKEVNRGLDMVHGDLLNKSENGLKENIREASNYDEFKKIMKSKKGFIRAFWCENEACETKIKQDTKASTRILEINKRTSKGKCIYCGKPAEKKWLFAQAY